MSHLQVMNEGGGTFPAFTTYLSSRTASHTSTVKINLKRGTILQLTQHISPQALFTCALRCCHSTERIPKNTRQPPDIIHSSWRIALCVFCSSHHFCRGTLCCICEIQTLQHVHLETETRLGVCGRVWGSQSL